MGDHLMEALYHIDPAGLTYQEWCNVGMALKEEGYSVHVWDEWSVKDINRYKLGECERKWRTFDGSTDPVTGGTIYQMAKERGYTPEKGHVLDWNDTIQYTDSKVVIDRSWLESKEVIEPKEWDPVDQVTRYIEALFDADDYVGYLMESYHDDKRNKYIPKNRGCYATTAGHILNKLAELKNLPEVLGDYTKEAGAWIRFNPLDGKGVSNNNVVEHKYALVESDSMSIDKQNAMIRELELPVAALVYSGGKSLHAIVRIDAKDFIEYKERVNYLYDVCARNGMSIDTQNRNPSRLSRLPGVERGEHKQFLVDTNIGKSSWDEWKEWIEGVNDNLPEVTNLSDEWDRIPPLAPELIKGILREGHKMLIAGPSKAGKSFLLIELCIAIAEGTAWIDHGCAQGEVLYINLELDSTSCLHRFEDVYRALGLKPANVKNIDIWNLRGQAIPLDKLVPKLIRRAKKRRYKAVVIDPIYKVITGDENSADQMAQFCNQFDKICAELNCAVIYCHHHSKGAQGGKRTMDRASGSGVFARDPDAMLDMIELPVPPEVELQMENDAICKAVKEYVFSDAPLVSVDWNSLVKDDWDNSGPLLAICENTLNSYDYNKGLMPKVNAVREQIAARTAWRIDGVFREFEGIKPIDLWFSYPIHKRDDTELLGGLMPEDELSGWQKMMEKRQDLNEKKNVEIVNRFTVAFETLQDDNGLVEYEKMANELDVDKKEIGKWLGKNSKVGGIRKSFERYQPEAGKAAFIRRKNDEE